MMVCYQNVSFGFEMDEEVGFVMVEIVGFRRIRWCYFSKMDILMIGKDRIMP